MATPPKKRRPQPPGLPCPNPDCRCCHHKTLKTLPVGTQIRRYRRCRNCKTEFTTYESRPEVVRN